MPDPLPGAPTDRPRQEPTPTVLTTMALVLVRPLGPVNLGMIARLASNLGISQLRLVAPHVAADDDQALRFATSWGRDLLESAQSFTSLAEATADLGLVLGTSGEFHAQALGAPLEPRSVPQLLEQRAVARWGLVFGGEAHGLTAAELGACHGWLHLETFGANRSYNLAQAVAILSYLLARLGALPAPSAWRPPAATAGRLELIEARLHALLLLADHPPAQDARFRKRLARLLRTLSISGADADGLLGMIGSLERALTRRDAP